MHACDSVRRDAGVSEVRQACAGLASLATCPRQAQCRQACALKTTAHLAKIPLEKSAPARRSRVLARLVSLRENQMASAEHRHRHASHSESRSARTDVCEGRVIAPPVLLRRACALQAAGLVSSCSGSSTERSSAPGAGMTMYENESDLLSPFP